MATWFPFNLKVNTLARCDSINIRGKLFHVENYILLTNREKTRISVLSILINAHRNIFPFRRSTSVPFECCVQKKRTLNKRRYQFTGTSINNWKGSSCYHSSKLIASFCWKCWKSFKTNRFQDYIKLHTFWIMSYYFITSLILSLWQTNLILETCPNTQILLMLYVHVMVTTFQNCQHDNHFAC